MPPSAKFWSVLLYLRHGLWGGNSDSDSWIDAINLDRHTASKLPFLWKSFLKKSPSKPLSHPARYKSSCQMKISQNLAISERRVLLQWRRAVLFTRLSSALCTRMSALRRVCEGRGRQGIQRYIPHDALPRPWWPLLTDQSLIGDWSIKKLVTIFECLDQLIIRYIYYLGLKRPPPVTRCDRWNSWILI